MKRRIATLSLLLVFSMASFANAAEIIAQATLVKGKVVAATGKKTRAVKAKTNIFAGDKITTGSDGKIELKFKDASIIRLAANSTLNVSRSKIADGRPQMRAELKSGKNWIRAAEPSDKWAGISARTPLAVASVKGTTYRQDVAADTTTKVLVYQGEVEVENVKAAGTWPGETPKEEAVHEIGEPEEVSMEQWLEIVRELQQITITPDGGHAVADIPASDAQDSWVTWNQQQDAKLEKAE